jgi:hypothetical protein
VVARFAGQGQATAPTKCRNKKSDDKTMSRQGQNIGKKKKYHHPSPSRSGRNVDKYDNIMIVKRLNINHIPSLTGRQQWLANIVSTNILSLTGQQIRITEHLARQLVSCICPKGLVSRLFVNLKIKKVTEKNNKKSVTFVTF